MPLDKQARAERKKRLVIINGVQLSVDEVKRIANTRFPHLGHCQSLDAYSKVLGFKSWTSFLSSQGVL